MTHFRTKATAKNPLEADHIVSMKEIVQMEGFNRLPYEKQLEVLNLNENFIAMNKSANASKGANSWSEWEGWKNFTKDSSIKSRMIELENKAREALQEAIKVRIR